MVFLVSASVAGHGLDEGSDLGGEAVFDLANGGEGNPGTLGDLVRGEALTRDHES